MLFRSRRHLVAEFGGVLAVVAADGDDLAGPVDRERAHGTERSLARAGLLPSPPPRSRTDAWTLRKVLRSGSQPLRRVGAAALARSAHECVLLLVGQGAALSQIRKEQSYDGLWTVFIGDQVVVSDLSQAQAEALITSYERVISQRREET